METPVESDIKADSKKERRSPVLIAQFKGRYASGWRFAVSEAFRDSLDIKWTARMIQKLDNTGKPILDKKGNVIMTEYYSWTQGSQFNFSYGAILYDTRLAYEMKWSDALKHIKLYVQVDKDTSAKKLQFKLYRPTNDFLNVEEVEKIECSQKDFVAFLQTGILITSKNVIRDLFQEYEACISGGYHVTRNLE